MAELGWTHAPRTRRPKQAVAEDETLCWLVVQATLTKGWRDSSFEDGAVATIEHNGEVRWIARVYVERA